MTDESFNELGWPESKPEPEPEEQIITKTCEKHGDYQSKGMVIGFMKNKTIFTGCPKCSEERKREEEEQRQADALERKRRHHERFLEMANIPHRFKARNFDNFEAADAKQKKALAVCRTYAEEFEQNHKQGKGLILSGKPGTGKSHLAAAIIQSLYTKHQGQYMTLMELIRLVRGTWHKNSEKSEAQVLKELIHIDLLVIDEIGVQYGTDGEQNIIFDVLDGRYREQMPTILLTNQDKEGLTKCIGERVFDRLRETSTWVSFDWESYRPKARN